MAGSVKVARWLLESSRLSVSISAGKVFHMDIVCRRLSCSLWWSDLVEWCSCGHDV